MLIRPRQHQQLQSMICSHGAGPENKSGSRGSTLCHWHDVLSSPHSSCASKMRAAVMPCPTATRGHTPVASDVGRRLSSICGCLWDRGRGWWEPWWAFCGRWGVARWERGGILGVRCLGWRLALKVGA